MISSEECLLLLLPGFLSWKNDAVLTSEAHVSFAQTSRPDYNRILSKKRLDEITSGVY